jgi:hypothetical protein
MHCNVMPLAVFADKEELIQAIAMSSLNGGRVTGQINALTFAWVPQA